MSELRRYEATLVHKCGENPYMVMASADDGDYCEYQQAADEITRLRQLLSETEKREREARSPFEIVADWHDRQARTFKEMSHDWRSGEQGRKKAADAAKHHAGSAAALRLRDINERRAALERSEG